MKLAISIPVHEQPDVVADQVANIRKFVPTAVIVLHVSQNFRWPLRGLLKRDFRKLEGVFVNPERLPTRWGDLVHVHNSNFRFARTQGDFDYFAMHSSNDMFVAPGVEAYLETGDAGVHQQPTHDGMEWKESKLARADEDLTRIMSSVGAKSIFGSQIEGTFYRTELFSRMTDAIDREYQFSLDKPAYCREEIYYPTLAAAMARGLVTPYLYSSVCRREITPAVIQEVRAKIMEEDEYGQNGGALTPYKLYDLKNLYAVKRVARVMNDPLRRYIQTLPMG